MKKILVFLVMISLVMPIVIADPDDQTVNAEVEDFIDISVNNIQYGPVAPNSISDQISTITVEENNNVDLTVDITVTDTGVGDLFTHIIFDLEDDGFGDNTEIGVATLQIDIDDDSGANDIPTRLQVPVGFAPGSTSGVVEYIAMKRIV